MERYKESEDGEDLDEDGNTAKWDKNVESASDEARQALGELISQIRERFDCEIEAKSYWLYCCVRKPIGNKNAFAVLDCHKNTANVCFRINPQTFQGDEHVRLVNGWFFPRGTKRRMTINGETIPGYACILSIRMT